MAKSRVPAVYPDGATPQGVPLTDQAQPRDDGESDASDESGEFEGFESQTAFISHYCKTYTDDLDADRHNLDEAKEDLRFTYVDQWDKVTRAQRESEGRPCITVNTLPQFVGQVVGNRRLNKTSVKVVPSLDATVKEAEVRTGLIRSIENASRAERLFDMCCEDQVVAGVSNFEVTLEYSYNDVFYQDIFFRPLDNPFAVVWDRFSKDPTGRDAKHCFVEESMDRRAFEKEYPEVSVPSGTLGEYTFGEENMERDEVKIVALWRMIERPATFALMQDGTVQDVTDRPEEEWMQGVYVDDQGQPYVKEGRRTFAQRYLMTSTTILEGPYELPLSRLPIIKVSGRVGRVGTKQYRFGLVRWARDPSLMRNYWRSIAVETLAMAPRAQWIADHASVKGRENDFREAHLSGDPLLVYNTAKNPPKRVDPPQLPTAVLNEAAMNTQDIKDTTGLYDASLGIQGNEVSGRAIQARQRQGDVATVVYADNLNQSIQEAGVVANELLPLAYDTTRMTRVIGEDEQVVFQKINDPYDENSVDITDGKYDVQIVTGPSYNTKRQESSELLLEIAKVNPALFEVAGDILMETQDIPGGERIAARLRKMLPAAQAEEAEKQQQQGQEQQPTPEQIMQMEMLAQQKELADAQQQAALAEMAAKVAEAEAKAREAEARANEAEARARDAELEIEIKEENIRKARAEAEKAEANAVIADDNITQNREQHEAAMQQRHDAHVVSIHQKMNPPDKSSGANRNSGGGSRSAGDSRPRKARA